MRSAFHQPLSDGSGALFRRRTAVLGLVLAAHALLVIMLLRQAPPTPPSAPAVTTFELILEPQARAVAKPKDARKRPARRSPTPPAPPAEAPPFELDIITLTREAFAAADIAKLPSHKSGAPSADAAEEMASTDAAGSGPNGERLYNAEWYREPTQAELAYYLPGGGVRTGWAMIACQTVADFRVDNCVELGQSPAGSGLAAAIRQAAWQFRVWPPRIGGRPLVGAWVRIRIDFTQVAAK